jgi:hypothetical protein
MWSSIMMNKSHTADWVPRFSIQNKKNQFQKNQRIMQTSAVRFAAPAMAVVHVPPTA